ncbi:MAG: S-layer homology domain-containing protein [Clostridia bacterium]|nr:S-layer homology domain-containing protein [Clostridia bacterium]
MKKNFMRVLCIVLTIAILAIVPAFAAGHDQFTDVSDDSWYVPYVDFVAEHNYMNGISATEFAPDMNMTRAMFVTVLSRLETETVNPQAETQFVDCEVGSWYNGGVDWAVSKNIVNGTSETTFSPDLAITRQELATMIGRYVSYVEKQYNKKHVDEGTVINFGDGAQIADWAKDDVNIAVSRGLIVGDENSNFRPLDNATRAEVAAVVYRLHCCAICCLLSQTPVCLN